MDKVKQTLYAVKDWPQGMLGNPGCRQITGTADSIAPARSRCGGDDAPELICICDVIPFPHFISQCTQLRVREAYDAIAHVQDTDNPRDCNTGVHTEP